jgi:Outer membrane protein beta-barrel domain
MQKTILATLAVLVSTAVACATDLPSKKAPVAPAAPTFTRTEYYVGYNAGLLRATDRVYSGGAVAGWNALSFLAVEGAYNYNYDNKNGGDRRHNSHTAVVNVLPQYRIPGTAFIGYAVAGAGYRWDQVTADHAVYNYGAGVKYQVAKDVEFDFRYTRVEAFDTKYRGVDDRFTAGVNYKF